MPNDGTGAGWITTAPANADPVSDAAKEIRDLRLGVAIRQDKEHVAAATSSAGGEHKAGSAKAYVQAGAPTQRPDAATVLTSGDQGRLWIDTDDNQLWYLLSTTWTQLLVSNVLNAAITAAKLASDSVTTVKILDANVTTAKLALGAVTSSQLADNAVTTTKITDGHVTAAKLNGDIPITKLDATLNTLLGIRCKVGSYTGNSGTQTSENTTVGFTPSVVLIVNSTTGEAGMYNSAMGTKLVRFGSPPSALGTFTVSATGFTLTSATGMNTTGTNYYYVVLKVNA